MRIAPRQRTEGGNLTPPKPPKQRNMEDMYADAGRRASGQYKPEIPVFSKGGKGEAADQSGRSFVQNGGEWVLPSEGSMRLAGTHERDGGEIYSDGPDYLPKIADAIRPFLGTDEQSSVGKWLKENFSGYASADGIIAPVEGSKTEVRNKFFSKTRAQAALSGLEQMRASSGASEESMGSGYSFLKNTIALLDKYGGDGANGMTRANFNSLQKEFEDMASNADANIAQIGRAFLNPTVGGESVMSVMRDGGRTQFGTPNTKLFT